MMTEIENSCVKLQILTATGREDSFYGKLFMRKELMLKSF